MKLVEIASQDGMFGAIPLYIHNEVVLLATQAKLTPRSMLDYHLIEYPKRKIFEVREKEKLALQEALCVLDSLEKEQKCRFAQYQLKKWKSKWHPIVHRTISDFQPKAEHLLVLDYLVEGNFLVWEGEIANFIGVDDECSEYHLANRLERNKFVAEWLLAMRDARRVHRKKGSYYFNRLSDKLCQSGCLYMEE